MSAPLCRYCEQPEALHIPHAESCGHYEPDPYHGVSYWTRLLRWARGRCQRCGGPRLQYGYLSGSPTCHACDLLFPTPPDPQ